MLDNVRKSIQNLIALYEAEKAEAARLRAALAESNGAKESYRKRITELEEQIDNLKLTAAFTNGGSGDTGAREKIERMIREIDRCISIIEES